MIFSKVPEGENQKALTFQVTPGLPLEFSSYIYHTNMEKSGSDKIATTMNILKLPYYLLIVSGHTLSTDGVTLSRRMVVFSGAIFLFNSILLVKNLTCLDKDIQSVRSIENLCSTMYQIVMLIVVSVTLFDSLKQVPLFVKKLEKLNELIDKESLRNEIQTTVKWMTVVGFVFSTTMAVVVPLFKLLMYSSSSWDHCPIHRSLFNSPRVYDHVSMFLNVATANVAFQGVAGMTLFVSMCSVLALFFKHLHAEIKRCGGLLHMRIDSETGGGTEQKPPELIQRIRTLYEYTCELTEILDDVITVQVGLQLVVGIPMISFTTYNTFVPEFRVDFMFYGLFVFFYSLIYLLATVNVNSQVRYIKRNNMSSLLLSVKGPLKE